MSWIHLGNGIFIWLCLSLASIGFAVCSHCDARPFSSEDVGLIVRSLKDIPEGQRNELRKILSHPKVERLPDTFSLNVEGAIKLTHDRYTHFTETYALNKLRRFMGKWRTVLNKAEKKFDVDKEVIAAILLVETGLGRATGRQLVLSVFASLYLDTAAILHGKVEASVTKAALPRVKRKNKWALNELKALLAISQVHGFDLLDLRGSYAGAFGACQFLPSSYQRWAVAHHHQAKKPDLFWIPDALFSTANYLKEHGYRKSGPLEAQRKAIWKYNNSDVYVDTILKVAQAVQ